MASLEQRGGKFRIVFRYRGQKYTRSLKTNSPRAAAGVLARVEDNLSRLELGHLALPDGAAVSTFVLSDGRLEQRPGTTKLLKTLEQLFDHFLATLTPGALEPTTEHCIRIHIRHFKRVFGSKKPLRTLGLTTLQQYVDIRAKADGLRGKRLSAAEGTLTARGAARAKSFARQSVSDSGLSQQITRLGGVQFQLSAQARHENAE